MYLIDTHTHIFTEEFDSDREDAISRALDAGVAAFCLPNIDLDSVDRLHALCDTHPAFCFPMMGLHPTCVKDNFQKDLEKIKQNFSQRKYIAVGEVGIDLYWDKTFLREQTEAFEEQLRWSIDLKLPVAIHTREAFPEVFAALDRVGERALRGVFHSFGGSRDELEHALTYSGFYLGINGVVTYKNANFREYLPLAPLDRIVLETDAPYLTPAPHRGKRNEPSYLPYIAEKLAEVYGITVEEVAQQTSHNAKQLFFNCVKPLFQTA